MRILKIGFHSYKAFNELKESDAAQHLDIAPLTLIFGKNNSGKSAVARLPILLLGGMECNDGRILPIEVRGLSFGSRFSDIVYGGDFFGKPFFSLLVAHGAEKLDFRVTLYSPGALSVDDPPKVWSFDMKSPREVKLLPPSDSGELTNKWLGLLPADTEWDIWRKRATQLLEKIIHIGPIRASIKSAYPNESPVEIGRGGEGVVQFLRLDSELATRVASWYEENMDGWRLSLVKDTESFTLRVGRGAVSTNLAQGGEGLQQVLPIVSHQLLRTHGKQNKGWFLDIIEQPELHLHAAAQAPVADLFVDTALRGEGATIVETNSASILLRIQRRIAEGKIGPEQVAIYFVNSSSDGAHLQRIGLEKSGELEWWPSGVFEEDFKEVAAIRRAQRRQAGEA